MSDDPSIEVLRGPALATKFSAEDETICGYCARYGETDADGEQFGPAAFRESLVEIKAAGHRLPLLWMHDMRQPIGSWHDLVEVPEGLWGTAQINSDTAKGKEALSLVRRGDLSGLSVGFLSTVRRGPLINKARLVEVSLVSVPAANRARLQPTKLKDFASLGDLAAALIEGRPLVRRDAELVARKMWPGVSDGLDPEELERLAERIAARTRALKGT
jgi:uncharacterized protein